VWFFLSLTIADSPCVYLGFVKDKQRGCLSGDPEQTQVSHHTRQILWLQRGQLAHIATGIERIMISSCGIGSL